MCNTAISITHHRCLCILYLLEGTVLLEEYHYGYRHLLFLFLFFAFLFFFPSV